MKSYLNLDLLYCCFEYLYPLFYYMGNNLEDESSPRFEVYSPITKKGIYMEETILYCFDYISKKYSNNGSIFNLRNKFNHTKSHIVWDGNTILYKCEPFELSKEYICFLKSNKDIWECKRNKIIN